MKKQIDITKKGVKADSLTDLYKGMSFADAAKAIESKYKNRQYNSNERNAYEYEMGMLADMNDKAREKEKQKQRIQQEQSYSAMTPAEVPQQENEMVKIMEQVGYGKEMYPGGGNLIRPLNAMDQLLGNLLKNDPLASNTGSLIASSLLPGVGNIAASAISGAIGGANKTLSGMTNDDLLKPEKEKSNLLKSPYAPAIGGRALNLLSNAFTAFGKPKKQTPHYNPYEQQALSLLEQTTLPSDAMYNQSIRGYNTAKQGQRDGSSSYQVEASLNQNLYQSLMDQLSGIAIEDTNRTNAAKQNLASAQLQIGSQKAGENARVEDANLQNKANRNNLINQFTAQLAEDGKGFTRLALNDKMNQLYTNILNSNYKDFGVNPNIVQKIMNGEDPTELELLTLKNNKNPKASELLSFYEYAKKNS